MGLDLVAGPGYPIRGVGGIPGEGGGGGGGEGFGDVRGAAAAHWLHPPHVRT